MKSNEKVWARPLGRNLGQAARLGMFLTLVALASCGGGSGGGGSSTSPTGSTTPPPVSSNPPGQVPSSAYRSVAAFIAYLDALPTTENTDALNTGTGTPPVSDTTYPSPLP